MPVRTALSRQEIDAMNEQIAKQLRIADLREAQRQREMRAWQREWTRKQSHLAFEQREQARAAAPTKRQARNARRREAKRGAR